MIKILNVLPKPDRADKIKVEPELQHRALTSIVEDPKTRDLPYLVISLAGTRRCGKSFLANLIISFLNSLSEVSRSTKGIVRGNLLTGSWRYINILPVGRPHMALKRGGVKIFPAEV